MIRALVGLVVAVGTFLPVLAFEPVSDCVIENFRSDITLQTDSSLLIEENLEVNCGTLPNKHGIFRVLPTKAPDRLPDEYPYTPFELMGITNEKGEEYYHLATTSSSTNTTTLKIGEEDVVITGTNHYRIKYKYQNAVVRRGDKDQLRWNLNGNFWELPINNLDVKVHLPSSQTETTTQVFSGYLGETSNQLATFKWLDENTVQVVSLRPLNQREGVTLEAQFPTGKVELFQPSFMQKYGMRIYWGALLAIFLWISIFAYRTWLQHGKELVTRRPVTVEYDPPKGLTPLEVGIYAGEPMNRVMSATIVDLAIRGYLKIEEVPGGFLKKKDWKITRLKKDVAALTGYEIAVLEGLFVGNQKIFAGFSLEEGLQEVTPVQDEVLVSSLKNKFHTTVNSVSNSVKKNFQEMGWWDMESSRKQTKFIIWGIILIMFGFVALPTGIGFLLLLSGGVLVVFGGLMSRRTEAGAEVLRLIKGFQLYMGQAEKYRMQFYERENIFEKYLPYAIAFGLTGKWIKAFKDIYGAEAAHAYAPVWYAGHSAGAFDFSSFESQMNSIASDIGSTLTSSPSSSGSGGSSSGGGGGGGGGGSW